MDTLFTDCTKLAESLRGFATLPTSDEAKKALDQLAALQPQLERYAKLSAFLPATPTPVHPVRWYRIQTVRQRYVDEFNTVTKLTEKSEEYTQAKKQTHIYRDLVERLH